MSKLKYSKILHSQKEQIINNWGGIFSLGKEWLSLYLRLLVFEHMQYLSDLTGRHSHPHNINADLTIFLHPLNYFPACSFSAIVWQETMQVECGFLFPFLLNNPLKREPKSYHDPLDIIFFNSSPIGFLSLNTTYS